MTTSMSAWSEVLPALIAAQSEFTRNVRDGRDAEVGPRFLLPREDLAALITPSDADAFGLVQSVAIDGSGVALVVCAVVVTNANSKVEGNRDA